MCITYTYICAGEAGEEAEEEEEEEADEEVDETQKAEAPMEEEEAEEEQKEHDEETEDGSVRKKDQKDKAKSKDGDHGGKAVTFCSTSIICVNLRHLGRRVRRDPRPHSNPLTSSICSGALPRRRKPW